VRWVFIVLMLQHVIDAFAKNYNDAFEFVQVLYSILLASVQYVVCMYIHCDKKSAPFYFSSNFAKPLSHVY